MTKVSGSVRSTSPGPERIGDSGPQDSEPKMVRFCALCGEREDNPARTQWCDPDPMGDPRPYRHRWNNPEKVFPPRAVSA